MLEFWTWVTKAPMIPGPGASVDARAAMMCTAAHGLVGAAVGMAPAARTEAARMKAEKAFVIFEGCSEA